MDYVTPVEAVIPGVQGKVLGVLSRTEAPLTMRNVAQLAGVSANRASAVLNHLVTLGLVERQEAGSAALVTLRRDNQAGQFVLALADLREVVLAQLRLEAETIQPPPVSLVIFGSFAAGTARAGSDLDVLAVRGAEVAEDNPGWGDSLGRWADRAGFIAGNPVNLIQAAADDIPKLLRRRGTLWPDIARNGIVLLGADLHHLGRAK